MVSCSNREIIKCNPLTSPCLFDVINDPCENENLAEKFPNILNTMMVRLDYFNSTAIAPGNLPIDDRGNPLYFNRVWTNFGDLI